MKKLSLNRLYFYLLLMVIVFGCASFPKKKTPVSNLNSENISNLNGRYELIEKYSGGTKDTSTIWKSAFNFSSADRGHYPTFFDEINFQVFKENELKVDSLKTYSFTLKLIDSKNLKIDYYENDSLFFGNTIKYKFKNDGYIYLISTNSEVVGIPYLFGGVTKKRSRITLNKENDLLFETSEVVTGGLLFVLVNPGEKMKYEKVFQRIE
ncbi:hypothetical protein NO995_16070 [Aestuariibaculum sp. M13]|uniref:hypothetical protein n=1 Tax=Aestuariibaculum sp. M13 TaxID=2967132 RepID=UPI002159DB1E|nr:hypothetical protein [Aestuariibaculum sp. M13]MCR8669204.1 hypothetical protein [Aestuariibaculum sp. M13]